MGFLDFLNPTRGINVARSFVPGFEERSSGIVPPPRSATSGVTTNDALSLASVYRSISLIATAMKQLGIHAYRDDIKVTPTPLWIRQPDPKITREIWMEQTVNSMALSGNAYWLISRNPRNETIGLEVLNPFEMMIQTDDYGNALYYLYRGTIKYALTDVQHLAMMRVPGNVYGLGPIQAAQKELLNAKDTRDFAANWFTDSGMAGQIYSPKINVSPDMIHSIADSIRAARTGGAVVMPTEVTAQSMYLNPKDAQFIEVQNFSVAQIARIFGIPANMLLAAIDGNSMTYTNMEQEQMAFVRYTLSQYIVEIESAMSYLATRGMHVSINVDSLLRSDTLTRYQAHQIAIDSGWMTIDEVRAIENLPVVEGEINGLV